MRNLKLVFALCIVFVVVATFLFTRGCSGCNKPTGEANDSAFYWKNKYNQTVTSLRAKEAELGKVEKRYLDSIAKLHNVKRRDIKEVIVYRTKEVTTVQPEGVTEIVYRDTGRTLISNVKNVRQKFVSPYHIATAQIGDSSYLQLQSFDTVSVVWKDVKEGNIFNRKRYLQLDLTHANQDIKIEGVKRYRKYEKPKRYAIGVQGGYGVFYFDGALRAGPTASIGLTRTFIKF